jgi:SpoVK/Ycf46/Vps4 family AAA+-type ATPase
MISFEIIIGLIESFQKNNMEEFDKKIKELIKKAEAKGQTNVARRLREILANPNSGSKFINSSSRQIFSSSIRNTNNQLFQIRKSNISSKDVILSEKNMNIFNEIKSNYHYRDIFLKNGLQNETKVLLFGPPGTGKTSFAYALAGDLGMPILHVYIDTLISSYLGETGKNIRSIFQEAAKTHCILLLDEFDAIAKQRDDMQELGELKRVVTVLLQNIDEFAADNILIAATNHEHLLDKAIWRRFDYQINLNFLDKKSLIDLYKLFLKDVQKDIDYDLLADLSIGISGSTVKKIVNTAMKRNLLNSNKNKIQESIFEELIKNLTLRTDRDFKAIKGTLSKVLKTLRKSNKKYTFEYLEQITGVPHSTLYNLVK